MRRSGFFFYRLLSTVLVVAVPLLAVQAWTLYRELDTMRQNASDQIKAKSASAALAVEETLDSAERLLTFVATHPSVTGLDPVRCSEFLSGLEAVEPLHAVVSILDATSQVICVSVKTGDRPLPRVGHSPWFDAALASDGHFLGKAAIGRITGRAVAPMSLAMLAPDEPGARRIGIAVVSIDLLRLESLMARDWSAGGGVLALLDRDGRFLVRSPATVAWLGREASSAARSSSAAASSYGIVTAVGVDGQERIFASTGVSKYGLEVVASIPADVVLAKARHQVATGSAIAVAALLLAAAFAYSGARSLARPLRSLAATARAFALGQPGARADESLPGEFRELAEEMNLSHAARERSAAAAAVSEKGLLRLSRFYEATSRTNKAIVHLKDAAELYDTICQVCVETGQASMAWVGLMEGTILIPVAWAGRAREYTRSFTLDLAPQSFPAGGAFGAAVLEGRNRVVNDYMSDPRTLPFRDNAELFGIGASAIVPFSRGGVVIGTLNVYASEVGFFDEQVERLLTGMAEDVSFALDNYEMAAVHRQTVAALSRREGQLAGIIESAQDAIITVDASQRVVVFNGAAAAMFELPVAMAIGGTADRFFPEPHRAPTPGDGPRRGVGLRPGGIEFPIELSTFQTHDPQGMLTTLVIRDVTGERDAERARIAAAESDAANRAKTEFLSRMSHELRTPLNAVLGFTQLLQASTRDKVDDTERHQLELILLAGTQLRGLVDDVLDLSVIEAGQLSMARVDLDLRLLVEGVLRLSEGAAGAAGVQLPAFLGSAAVTLHADPIRVRQVVFNLVSNAIKYNRRGGSVTVTLETAPGVARLIVADDGLGMSEEQLAGLFEPFNRLGRENTDIAGTGIGMALARKVVRMMEGSIVVDSRPGLGTTVTVELPLTSTVVLASPLAPPAGLEVASPPADAAMPSGLVLYIEDAPVNVLVVQHVLRRWPGVTLLIAVDGRSGIERVRSRRPDVVLLDMRLPDMSGLDVLRALRTEISAGGLQVVALSASAMPLEVQAARAAGAHDYWTKPIDVASFAAGMRELLQASALRREADEAAV